MKKDKNPIESWWSGALSEKQYRNFLNIDGYGTHEEIESTIYRGILGMYGLVRRKS